MSWLVYYSTEDDNEDDENKFALSCAASIITGITRYPLKIPISKYYLEVEKFRVSSRGKVGGEPGMRPRCISLISHYRTALKMVMKMMKMSLH